MPTRRQRAPPPLLLSCKSLSLDVAFLQVTIARCSADVQAGSLERGTRVEIFIGFGRSFPNSIRHSAGLCGRPATISGDDRAADKSPVGLVRFYRWGFFGR